MIIELDMDIFLINKLIIYNCNIVCNRSTERHRLV